MASTNLAKALKDLYPDLVKDALKRSSAEDAALLLRASENLALVAVTEGEAGLAEAQKAYKSTLLQLAAARDAQVRRALNDFGRKVARLLLAAAEAAA